MHAQTADTTWINQQEKTINIAWDNWNLPELKSLYHRSIRYFQEQQLPEELLDAYIGIATTAYYQNQLDSTRYFLQKIEANNLLEAISKDHESWRLYYNIKAVNAYQIGDYQKSATITERLLNVDIQNNPENYKAIAIHYNNLGLYYDEMGDYGKAREYLKRSLQIKYNQTEEYYSTNTVETLNNLAHLEFIDKSFANADSLYQAALDILKQLPPNDYQNDLYYQLLQNIALNHIEQYNYSTAEDILNQCLRELKSTDSPNLFRIAVTHQFLGRTFLKSKKYPAAEDEFNKSLQILKGIRSPNHPRIAELYSSLGTVALRQHNEQQALLFFQRGLTTLVSEFQDTTNIEANPLLNQTVNSRVELYKILNKKAKALRSTGKLESALATAQLNMALLDSLRINYLSEGSKLVLVDNAQKVYETAIEIAFDLERPDLAFEYFERSKAALLLENIKRIQANQFANLPDSTLQQERDFKVEIAYQERQLLAAQREQQTAAVDSLRSILFEKRQRYQQFLTDLEQSNPRYFQLKYDTRVASLAEVQKELLSADDLLITYFVGEEWLYSMAITRDSVQWSATSKPTEILDKVSRLRELISRPQSKREDFFWYNRLASELYADLIGTPTENILTANTNLLILPAAELGNLPFQVLLKNDLAAQPTNEARYDTLSYLIKEHPISYGFSATLLLESTSQPINQSTKFAGFAPVFSDTTVNLRSLRNQLGKLQYSLAEVQGIQELMQGDIFINETASVTNFREQLANYNILHLATHAQLNDAAPNDSRIYFYDDYLTVAEIYNLPLQADLVVLSACETGTGKLQRGEGLISLARAFAYANCPSLVTSLWQIDDATTADLMVGFYKNLQMGQSKPQALQSAQLDYLQRADISYQQKHPFYWAAFVQIGEAEAIVNNNSFSYFWFAMGALCFVVLTLLSNRIFNRKLAR